MLMDQFGNLKITDFGLANSFVTGGVKRTLKKFCGSPPYTAPEVCLLGFFSLSHSSILIAFIHSSSSSFTRVNP